MNEIQKTSTSRQKDGDQKDGGPLMNTLINFNERRTYALNLNLIETITEDLPDKIFPTDDEKSEATPKKADKFEIPSTIAVQEVVEEMNYSAADWTRNANDSGSSQTVKPDSETSSNDGSKRASRFSRRKRRLNPINLTRVMNTLSFSETPSNPASEPQDDEEDGAMNIAMKDAEKEKTESTLQIGTMASETTADEKLSPELEQTNKEKTRDSDSDDDEKAKSLSPVLVSDGVSEISVKQFYGRADFLENKLGIEKDPKIGEIVGILENIKAVSDKMEEPSKQQPKQPQEDCIKLSEEIKNPDEDETTVANDDENELDTSLMKSHYSKDDDWTNKSTNNKETKPAEDTVERSGIIETHMNECDETAIVPAELVKLPIQSNDSENAVECVECTDATDITDIDNVNNNETPAVAEPTKFDALPPASAIDFHTERTKLDDKLDGMLNQETSPKPSIPIDCVAKLKGINLQTNDLKISKPMSQPKPIVQKLFNRFIKSPCVKKIATPETKDPTTISISTLQAAAEQSEAVTVQAKIPAKSEVAVSNRASTSAVTAASPAAAASATLAPAPSDPTRKAMDILMQTLIEQKLQSERNKANQVTPRCPNYTQQSKQDRLRNIPKITPPRAERRRKSESAEIEPEKNKPKRRKIDEDDFGYLKLKVFLTFFPKTIFPKLENLIFFFKKWTGIGRVFFAESLF